MADVKSRICRDVGEDACKPWSIGNNCDVVLGSVGDAMVLARCFLDAPPRWTDALGATHILRAHRDRSGAQLAAGRALGVFFWED